MKMKYENVGSKTVEYCSSNVELTIIKPHG